MRAFLITCFTALMAVSPALLAAQGVARKPAPAPIVTAVTTAVSVGSYRGPCPAKLVFTGTITTATIPKGPVTYQWIRSDNVKEPKRTITMTATTATVTAKWQAGRPGEQMRVWQKLQVIAPNGITSNQADAIILCS